MKRMGIVIFLLTAITGLAPAQDRVNRSDKNAIEQVIENWNKGWKSKDPKLAAKDYSEDADWTNAFGMTKKGRSGIETFLTEVFSLPFVMAGESSVAEQSIRFVKPDIALVVTRVERVGQRNPAGESIGTRQTSHLRVLEKAAGQWKIVSHLIADARDPQASRH